MQVLIPVLFLVVTFCSEEVGENCFEASLYPV